MPTRSQIPVIQDWIKRQSQPVSLKDIARKFGCSWSTAYHAAIPLMVNREVSVCTFGRERHFSKRRD